MEEQTNEQVLSAKHMGKLIKNSETADEKVENWKTP
jgi:hypothetical protein